MNVPGDINTISNGFGSLGAGFELPNILQIIHLPG
jgi:hypothetical protein